MARILILLLEWEKGKTLDTAIRISFQILILILNSTWSDILFNTSFRNAGNKDGNHDFIPVKGDVEMDLDINKEMSRDQEEALMNS